MRQIYLIIKLIIKSTIYQDFTMKFIGESYYLYAKNIHQIWCRVAKFLWKSKFWSESGSGSGSGSWYYFGFQYQTYISYIEDTHQILFVSANSFESYCVHMKSPRTYSQTDRRKFFLCLFCLLRHTKHKHSSKGENFISQMTGGGKHLERPNIERLAISEYQNFE